MNLQEIFSEMDNAKIAVIGDFCLDVYWLADMKRSVLSREAPHYPLPVTEERMSPGGAGNVAANVAALRPAKVTALGVIGPDWRGGALQSALRGAGVDADKLITAPGRVTNAYIKPLRGGISEVVYEDPRLDFENYTPQDADTENRLLRALQDVDANVLCVCDQMRYGCVTPRVREAICELGAAGKTVLVDSRERIGLYRDVIVKPNEVEAARALGLDAPYEEIARALSARTGRPALVTLGDKGCLVCEGGVVAPVPARKVEPPIDICGAGDTFLAGLACALAAGASLCEAAWFANTASSITIRKIKTTGVASREEIRQAW